MAIRPNDAHDLDRLIRSVNGVLDRMNDDWAPEDGDELRGALEDTLGEFQMFRRRHGVPLVALVRRRR